ncbi:hypothetical protein EDD85DRAFT_871909 [Armillaria nabsnona]|nr:hypothetical protein EDD85DRAFT_871909 [Armillaria nabsnona]
MPVYSGVFSQAPPTGSAPKIPRVRILELDNCEDILVRLSNDIAQNSAPLSVRHLRILRILNVREASDLTSIKTIIEKSGGIPLKLRAGPGELVALSFPPFLNHLHLNLNDYEHRNEQGILRWWINASPVRTSSCPRSMFPCVLTHTILACTGLLLPMYSGVHSNHHPFAISLKLASDEEMTFHLIEKELWSELDNALAGIQGLKEFMIKLQSEGDAADFEPLKDAI